MTIERSNKPEAMGRVVPFRPRRTATPRERGGFRRPIGDLRPFEQSRENADDYRHRMVVNAFAFLFLVFLVAAGTWLATTLADIRKEQDCVLSGRKNCALVEVPVHNRW